MRCFIIIKFTHYEKCYYDFFCFCFSYANAQDSSTALLTDGKVWHCVDAWLEEGSKIERNFSITVCGDTTVETVIARSYAWFMRKVLLKKNK